MRRSVFLGCGSYLPEKVVTNDDLAKRLETSDEWIAQRTGIRQRHIAAEGEYTSDLAVEAAKVALERASIDASEIDLVILATVTPDNTFPATATRVQSKLGIKQGAAFDVQAACSGFIYSLNTADNMLRLGQANKALLIGSECFSRIVDWDDRGTCVLFGDGAGAVVLGVENGDGQNTDRGVLSTHIYADGNYYEHLLTDGGPSTNGKAGVIQMEGREVFKHAAVRMAEAVETSLSTNGFLINDIDWLVPHQANIRIMDSVAKKLSIEKSKIIVTVDKQANTSAATIPLALADAQSKSRFSEGDLISLTAMGGGFTWGSALVRW
ncbi:ketoacyl-ACP synthase III [Alphaproteobacteria bacterium]|jgi:3-oxoacyl-[acyl-carrier-protein] synthase-3|nr:ketoacyl-ACP synthase III [Alphaproteobacteria bacterium]